MQDERAGILRALRECATRERMSREQQWCDHGDRTRDFRMAHGKTQTTSSLLDTGVTSPLSDVSRPVSRVMSSCSSHGSHGPFSSG